MVENNTMVKQSRVNSKTRSRFDSWPKWLCCALIVLTLSVITIGLVETPTPVTDNSALPIDKTDNGLYLAIIDRVKGGDGYYEAAVSEQGQRGYPLRPVMTVREPALSYIGAALRSQTTMHLTLVALAVIASILMLVRTERLSSGLLSWSMAMIFFGGGIAVAFTHNFVVIHEVWAVVFMIFALVASGARRPYASAAFGLVAVLVRELAFPFLIVMLVLAWRERRLREVRAWAVSIAIFAMGYAVHAAMVLSHTSSDQLHAPGWVKFGGWAFVLETVRFSSVLHALPVAVTAVVVPLALLGWISKRGEFADRVILLMAMYIPVFMVLGRPWNSYWGLLYTALLLPGLAFAPFAAVSLWKRLREPSRETILT